MKKVATYHNDLNEIEIDELPETTCYERCLVARNSCIGFICLFFCMPCYFYCD